MEASTQHFVFFLIIPWYQSSGSLEAVIGHKICLTQGGGKQHSIEEMMMMILWYESKDARKNFLAGSPLHCYDN